MAEGKFDFAIKGGVERKESKRIGGAASGDMSDQWWRAKDVPSDAVLTVEVIRIDGPDGEVVFDAGDFKKENATRLKILEQKFPQ